MVRTDEGGLDEDVRRDLREIAQRLRRLAERVRALELVGHDLARILERLADARSLAEVEATTVYCFVADGTAPTLSRFKAAPAAAGPVGAQKRDRSRERKG